MTRTRTRTRRSAGLTIFELVVVISILMCVITVTFAVLAQLTGAATSSAAGAAELALAAKMSEAFRNDVRQAKSAVCSAKGERVKLKLADGTVEYLRNGDGRIERRVGGQTDFIGPLVFDSKFEFQAGTATAGALVRATWTCRADAPAAPPGSRNAPQPAGRMSVLDTALRAGGEQ